MPTQRVVPGGRGWASARWNDLYCSAGLFSGIFDWWQHESATLATSNDGENALWSARPAREAGRGASWAIRVGGGLRGYVFARAFSPQNTN